MVHSATTKQGKQYWCRYLSPLHPQSTRSWFLWGQCPMTLVKTLTATSSRLHEPITDCCTSERQQENRIINLNFVTFSYDNHISIGKQLHWYNYIHTHTHTHHRSHSFQDAPRWASPCLWLGDCRKGWSQCWTYRWCQQPSVCPKTNTEKFTEWFYKAFQNK